jgi:predicted amidohydrolase
MAAEAERTSFRIAAVQMRSGVDRMRNIEAATALIGEAAEMGAHFIATPEMTNVVDRDAARLKAALPEGEDIEETRAFAALAERLGVFLLIGSMAIRQGEALFNRAFLFGPDGGLVARYDKIHMFDVTLENGETWRESRVYTAGAKAVIAALPQARIGLTICYDLRFPHLYRALSQAGAEVLCAPAAFTKQTGRAHWKALTTARAIECGAFLVAPAQGGLHEDGRETFGHSVIVSPWGETLAEARGDEPCVIAADIDPGRVDAARRQIPNLSLETAFEIITLDA